jgi:thiamine pyrophosphokinase
MMRTSEAHVRGLLFTGGNMPDSDFIRSWVEPFDFVVAADSGLDGAERAGFVPDLVIGDMDSISDQSKLEKYADGQTRRYPHDKDSSDTELALAAMAARGISDVVIIGGDGGRMDHFFALRLLFERDFIPSMWIGTESAVIALGPGCSSRSVSITGLRSRDPVSVFPAGKGSHRCLGTGFHWPPDSVSWDTGAFSLSNRADDDSVTLESVEGRFLLVLPFRRGLSVSRSFLGIVRP